jgi:hypothetical protein
MIQMILVFKKVKPAIDQDLKGKSKKRKFITGILCKRRTTLAFCNIG